MSDPALHLTSDPGVVWRVGHGPDPWAWTPWQYAGDNGLFDGRWDDQRGRFRTIYTAQTLVGCFVEVLARLRPDLRLAEELAAIDDDAGQDPLFPTVRAGAVGSDWLDGRLWAEGSQTGLYCDVTHSQSIAALAASGVFARIGVPAEAIGTAVLKDPASRVVTRSIAGVLYDLRTGDRRPRLDGVEFRSRHGDDLRMWALFERASDAATSRPSHIEPIAKGPIARDLPELEDAFALLRLHWHDET